MTRRTILQRARAGAERHAAKWYGPLKPRETRERAMCRIDYIIGFRDGWRAAKREGRR